MQQQMSLAQMLEQVRQINTAASAGRISPAQRATELEKLRGVDARGSWWCCTPQGSFLVYNGSQWVPAQPPNLPPPAQKASPRQQSSAGPQSPRPANILGAAPPGVDPVINSPIVRQWQRFAAIPFLAMLPALACGGLWFLYTLLRVGQEGLAGIDLLTPLAIVGLPILLSVFRKPIDRFLQPMQKFRGGFTPAFRWGAALALPVILGLVCSAIGTSGYGALNLTAILSILISYFLIHTPRVQQ